MKKLFTVCGLFLFVMTTKVSAQQFIARLTTTGNQPITVKEGMNIVTIPEGRGVFKFMKRGDSYSSVTYRDPSGSVSTLAATNGGTNGAPTPGCNSPLPDACFGIADKNIGMCICKSTDLAGNTAYTVVVSLPSRPVANTRAGN